MSLRNTRHQKNHEICTLCEVVAAQFYYCHSSKIANQWPLLGKICVKLCQHDFTLVIVGKFSNY